MQLPIEVCRGRFSGRCCGRACSFRPPPLDDDDDDREEDATEDDDEATALKPKEATGERDEESMLEQSVFMK